MTIKTEGRHAAEFLVSEANGTRSRDTATVVSGQNLVAGEVVEKDNDGKLTAFTAETDTPGDLVTEAAGVLWDDVDASDGDVEGAVFIARDAEVNLSELTYPDETTGGNEEQNTIDSLAKLHIIAR